MSEKRWLSWSTPHLTQPKERSPKFSLSRKNECAIPTYRGRKLAITWKGDFTSNGRGYLVLMGAGRQGGVRADGCCYCKLISKKTNVIRQWVGSYLWGTVNTLLRIIEVELGRGEWPASRTCLLYVSTVSQSTLQGWFRPAASVFESKVGEVMGTGAWALGELLI